MSNLFSSFSPNSWLNLPLRWLSSFFVIFLLPPIFWTGKSQSRFILTFSLKKLWLEFSSILITNSIPGILLPSLTLLSFILINNFLGLFPYIFTARRHLVFTFSLALPLWLGHILISCTKIYNAILAHLVPLGTPVILIPFIVLIELTRNLIRPLTLSVRLAANMIAGHLLLTLLANQASILSLNLALLTLSALIVLATLECAVSLIQAYVFSLLSSLYLNEVNLPQNS